jgi:glycosyltransferase involved in cell wall biosynthesis
MSPHGKSVAVLLATYNGTAYVEAQIKSLGENETPITLHWLDDHSTDGTPEAVRQYAQDAGIRLVEWNVPQHLGWPGTFFQLLEFAEADIYLFCDQDDIWQPGKIDATVNHLLGYGEAPTLCFSEALMFRDEAPESIQPVFEAFRFNAELGLQMSRAFTSSPAQGNTIGFTRPLREIFLKHTDIAKQYAFSHDWWMYLIAVATGQSHMLRNVPTVLYRIHNKNTSGFYHGVKSFRRLIQEWRTQQTIRRVIARQAKGFCLAAREFPAHGNSKSLLDIAKTVSTLDRRSSIAALLRLARWRALPPDALRAGWLMATCLTANAEERHR